MRSMQALALAAAAALAPAAMADFTDFDSFAEGFYGQSFEFDGITVFDVNNVNGVNPDGQPFTPDDIGREVIIERSVAIYNDFPDVISSPNTLTFGTAYVNGDNLSLGALSTMSMTTGELAGSATFDLIYLDEWVWDGIVVTLEALRDGTVVSSESFTIVGQPKGSRDIVDTRVMTVDGVEFDTIRLRATLGSDNTTFRALVDDVTIEPAAGCDADFDGDGTLSLADFVGFRNAYVAGDLAADFDLSGTLTLADFVAFRNSYTAGCP